jgi:hypothetical protein
MEFNLSSYPASELWRSPGLAQMIKLKMKHLRHPLRTAIAAGNLASIYLNVARLGNRSRRHFRGDARYDLRNVSRGFISRIGDTAGDAEILERICAAYRKADRQQQFAPDAYQATPWWQQVRDRGLRPVIEALSAGDIDSLGRMYRNFFRDPCAGGVIGVSYGMSQAYFGETIKNIHRRFFLGDALLAIDYWKMQTQGRFPLHALAGPEIGNPFGILIGDTLVRTGAAYQHYAAQRIGEYIDSESATVTEIGGGFGGAAYYLLRDHPGITYIDFDVPESVALTSYYLLKAFPDLRFLLYGESSLTEETLARADVILMPLFEMERMPSGSVDVMFSSHSISDLPQEGIATYLASIARATRGHLIFVGNERVAESIAGHAVDRGHLFQLEECRPSGWNDSRCPNAGEVECIYMCQATNAARQCTARMG